MREREREREREYNRMYTSMCMCIVSTIIYHENGYMFGHYINVKRIFTE